MLRGIIISAEKKHRFSKVHEKFSNCVIRMKLAISKNPRRENPSEQTNHLLKPTRLITERDNPDPVAPPTGQCRIYIHPGEFRSVSATACFYVSAEMFQTRLASVVSAGKNGWDGCQRWYMALLLVIPRLAKRQCPGQWGERALSLGILHCQP